MKQALVQHISEFPRLELQDAVKFLHQSNMGPGHLIEDTQASLRRLEKEYQDFVPDPSLPLTTMLGRGLCRLNLARCSAMDLPPEMINRLFIATASGFAGDSDALLRDLAVLESLPHFEGAGSAAFLTEYRAKGMSAIGHSAAFRHAYHPAYRVVCQSYVDALPIILLIDHMSADRAGPLLVAIDGPCGSGKTHLGKLLQELYHCTLHHMDDFFLPPWRKTPLRLSQPGGNIDYERFLTQVLLPLTQNRAYEYQRWNCRLGALEMPQACSPGPITVIEGTYSLHPALRAYYDLRIFCSAPWPVRAERLQSRGGPALYKRFLSEWIPLEDAYFSVCDVAKCCQATLNFARE